TAVNASASRNAGTLVSRLTDPARRDATRADPDVLPRPVLRHDVDSPQVGHPTPPRLVVRVADVVAELRALLTNVAYACHDAPSPIAALAAPPSRVRGPAARFTAAGPGLPQPVVSPPALPGTSRRT